MNIKEKDLIDPNIKLDARFFIGKIQEKKGWYIFLQFFIRSDEKCSSIPGHGCFYIPCVQSLFPDPHTIIAYSTDKTIRPFMHLLCGAYYPIAMSVRNTYVSVSQTGK